MTDAELIEATRQGDQTAFGMLVARYQRMVEGVVYGTTGRRALVDDVVQDTFVTAWRTLDRLRETARVRAWLCSIARNLARNARRRHRREAPLGEHGTTQTPFDDLCERERGRDIATALARLPARYREPLVLFYYEHCTVKEVADALAVGEDAIMQRLSRGRRRLGEELATNVEIALEKKPSRIALAACVLALLPVGAASAAPVATLAAPSSTPPTTTPWWRAVLAGLAAHWRIPAAALATAGALAVVVAASARSNALAAKSAEPTTNAKPVETTHPATTRPALPDDVDPDEVYRNIAVADLDPAATCARGASGLVLGALGKDALRVEGDRRYYEPTLALEETMRTVGARAAESCRGIDKWPEIYVICEGTVFDIMDGNVSCYPYDPFNS